MSRWRIVLLCALAAPWVLFGLTSAAYALDTRGDDGEVARGVRLAGVEIGGATRDEVAAALDRLADRLPDTPITIDTGDFAITTTAGDLGVGVDEDASLAAAMTTGHSDPWPLPPIRWAKALVADRPTPLRLSVDRARAIDTIQRLEGERRTAVAEPSVTALTGGLTMTPGVVGREVDVDDVISGLPSAIDEVGSPITISSRRVSTSPSVSDEAVKRLVDEANAATSGSIDLVIGDRTQRFGAAALRPALLLRVDDGNPSITVDPKQGTEILRTASGAPANPTGVTFSVGFGTIVPVAGKDAVLCCDDSAAAEVFEALLAGKTSVTVGTTTMTAAEGVEWAKTLGVTQVVGSFTTRHPAGQPRVANIHRISDLTRGALIAPGTTFSVNDFVGRRTPEKGFVSAPVIEEGQFSTDFGGGVSQFATTLFNAAFFAGLDIPEHKAHSIYISRYPFGREATLAYPSVDLKITNNTPYGVVIWPTYTGSSITIDLYSTPFAVGAQTDQNKTSGCGAVRVTRTRTFVADGRTENDSFTASYDCNPPKHP